MLIWCKGDRPRVRTYKAPWLLRIALYLLQESESMTVMKTGLGVIESNLQRLQMWVGCLLPLAYWSDDGHP